MSDLDLEKESRAFAGEVTDLLNHTVTDGIRLTAVITSRRSTTVHIGAGIGKRDLTPRTVPLAIDKRPPRGHLLVAYVLHPDHEDRYLAVTKSSYGVYLDEDRHEMCVHWDYDREPNNPYPEAHLQINGQSSSLAALHELGIKRHHNDESAPQRKKLQDFHFPVGGRRFRPTLEDVVEFLVIEQLANHRTGWDQVVRTSRATWEERQIRAAVRRNPETAMAQLQEDGRIPALPSGRGHGRKGTEGS
ncbi:MAG: hypothetical protein ACYDEY_10690 [Acidimicrobiales bacterium]